MNLTATTHDRESRICAGCAATDLACAVKAGLGGRSCCESCSHVVVTSSRIPKGEPEAGGAVPRLGRRGPDITTKPTTTAD